MKTRMFQDVTRTWNPVFGCLFNCRFCWARRLTENRLRKVFEKYKDGFNVPKIDYNEFGKMFKPGELVFVTSMGDLFGGWVKKEWVDEVLNHIKKFPETTFLFLTKNPMGYKKFLPFFPDNVILGATIETNCDEVYTVYQISKAPLPSKRIETMKEINGYPKFISIEPILEFTEDFPDEIREIEPEFVYVGYDNYNNNLPEPKLEKTKWLIKELRKFTTVKVKTLRKAWWEKWREK